MRPRNALPSRRLRFVWDLGLLLQQRQVDHRVLEYRIRPNAIEYIAANDTGGAGGNGVTELCLKGEESVPIERRWEGDLMKGPGLLTQQAEPQQVIQMRNSLCGHILGRWGRDLEARVQPRNSFHPKKSTGLGMERATPGIHYPGLSGGAQHTRHVRLGQVQEAGTSTAVLHSEKAGRADSKGFENGAVHGVDTPWD